MMKPPVVCLRVGAFGALAVAVAGMAGCKPPPPAPCFPVSGKVTLNKKPITTGTITFVPDSAKGNNSKESAMGWFEPDGSYSLKTNGRDGAPLGWYKVVVDPAGMPKEFPAAGAAAPKPVAIDAKYKKAATSTISKEVTETPKPGAYDIELK
jgi:hypothetical protein